METGRDDSPPMRWESAIDETNAKAERQTTDQTGITETKERGKDSTAIQKQIGFQEAVRMMDGGLNGVGTIDETG